MKTTAVFVEQVLIGAVVVLIFTLPFGIELDLATVSAPGGLGFLGIAYLIGIPADRFLDSVTGGLEKRNRGRYALRKPLGASATSDPFPEGELKIEVMKAGGDLGDWYDYLRHRIRLSRAIGALAPALTVSGILAVWPGGSRPTWAQLVGLGATFLVYAFAFCRVQEQFVPRTDKVESVEQVCWMRDPAIRILPALAAISVVLAFAAGNDRALLVLIGGVLLTAGAGWAWWRTTGTFMTFLVDQRKYAPAPDGTEVGALGDRASAGPDPQGRRPA